MGVGKSTVSADTKTARRPAAGGARLLFLANLYGTDPLRNIWQADLRYMNTTTTSWTADFASRLLAFMYVEGSHLRSAPSSISKKRGLLPGFVLLS